MKILKNWQDLVTYMKSLSPHHDVEISKESFDRVILQKYVLQRYHSIFGDPDGQIANYRIPLKDGSGIHIKEYDNKYKIHWDNSNLATDPVGHLINDAPHHIVTILGALILGYAIYKSR